MKFLKNFDSYILDFFNRRIKNKFFDKFFLQFTNLAGLVFTIILVGVLIMLPRAWGLHRLGWNLFLVLLVLTGLVHLIKILAKRIRPYDILEELNTFGIKLPDYSFPSGHTATALAIGLLFSQYFPSLAPLMLIYVILIASSRLYLGVHYPTDVLVGAILGLVVTLLVNGLLFESFYLYILSF